MKVSNTSERLKQIMQERGLKQVDILEKVKPYCEEYGMKISKPHISQWVSGINEPNSKNLTILGLALEVDEVWLMGFDVPMSRKENQNIKDGELLAEVYKNELIKEITEKLVHMDTKQQAIVLELIKQIRIEEE